jgi:hypothetical protein
VLAVEQVAVLQNDLQIVVVSVVLWNDTAEEIAQVGIVTDLTDSALEPAVVVGLVQRYCSRMLHLGLSKQVQRVHNLWKVEMEQPWMGELVEAERFPGVVSEVETYMVRRHQKLASFHSFEAVRGTDYNFHFVDLALGIQNPRESEWMKDHSLASLRSFAAVTIVRSTDYSYHHVDPLRDILGLK